MKTWLRRSLLALLALLVLLAAALAWLVASFDPNQYKSLAIDWVKAHRNRTLAIDGPVRLALFPRLEVQLSRVSLSEHGRAERFASIDEAALAVRVLPLLRRQLQVDRISARGVGVVLTRDAQGRRNIDDLLGGPGAAAAPPPQQAPAEGGNLVFDISRVELADVKASVRDEQVPLRGDIVLVSLSSGRLADRVQAPVDLNVQLALQQPAVQGTLSGSTRLTFDLSANAVQLAGAQLRYQGDVPGATGLDVTLKGDVAYDGGRGAVRASGLEVTAAATAGDLRLAPSTLQAATLELDPARKSLVLGQLRVKLAAMQGQDRYGAELEWPQLAVGADSLQGSALKGQLDASGNHSLRATFASGAPAGNFDLLRVPALVFTLEGRSGPRSFSGKLGTDLTLRPGQAAAAFGKLALQATVNEPGLPALQLGITGSADGSRQAAGWKLAGQLNANQFSTEGKADLTGKVPRLQAQARFDALDLNKVLGAPSARATPQAASGPAPADTPVPLDALERLNGQFGLRAGSLVFRQYQVRDAALDATLESGVLRIVRLQGRAWDGSIDASGFADARASRAGVKLAASGVDINALLKDVAGKDILAGNGRVVADLQTAGKTVGEMRSRLSGSGALQLRDGAIKGVNLAQSFRRAKAALGGSQDEVEQARQTEKTDFSELSATFQVADGVARSTDLDAKSPFLRLGGEGSADIGRGRIDYTARATVAATSKGQEGAELEALRGVTVPVHLSGPFDAIAWKIQWSAIASAALKGRTQERLKEAEEKLKGRLAERLGLGSPAAPASAASAAPAPAPRSTTDQARDKLKDKLKGLLK